MGPGVGDPQGDPDIKVRYARLLDREFPLKYPLIFNDLTLTTKTDLFVFDELDPAANHLFQAFLGQQDGFRTQVWHPFDERLIRFDQRVIKIPEDETANITNEESPFDAPVFNIWIGPGKRFPGLIFQNISDRFVQGGKTLKPSIIWLLAKYTWIDITSTNFPEIYNGLESLSIQSTPISFGRKV